MYFNVHYYNRLSIFTKIGRYAKNERRKCVYIRQKCSEVKGFIKLNGNKVVDKREQASY